MNSTLGRVEPLHRPKVLVVCDEGCSQHAWRKRLEEHCLPAAAASQEAVRLLAEHLPDLVIIDANRAASDILGMCESFRQITAVPILLFTKPAEEDYILAAYRAGADECILKPISPALSMAKVLAWLRRAHSAPAEELNALQVGGFRLEPRCRALILEDGRRVHLSLLELRLLLLLMSRPGHAVSSKEILWRVWGYQDSSSQTELKNVVYRLRHKIEPDPHHPQHLLTEGHWGYRWVGD